MIKVAVFGASGRMGRAIISSIQKVDGMQVVAAVEQPEHPDLGRDAGEVAGVHALGVLLTDDRKAIAGADVAIDFTLHAAVPKNATAAAELGIPLVIGTTGLDEAERAEVERAAAKVPVVWAPNMSLAVNLMFALAKKAAATLGMDYQVEIDETHHVHKIDAPSGTALRLGQKVAEGRGQDFGKVMVHHAVESPQAPLMEDEPEVQVPENGILITSYREGEVVGDHTVTFGTDGETLEITHHAWSREAFAMGALHAAKWLQGKRPRIYDMQDVLGL